MSSAALMHCEKTQHCKPWCFPINKLVEGIFFSKGPVTLGKGFLLIVWGQVYWGESENDSQKWEGQIRGRNAILNFIFFKKRNLFF